MRIRKIQLNNFRQFYSEQELEFAIGDQRNVTLVHAENGFGKTTILNAVLWAFFNQTTKKFEHPEQIVNFTALEEGNTTAMVGVEFEYNEQTYLASRHFDERGQGQNRTKLAGFRIESGALQVLTAPQTFIESVIPPEMARYFFFDGEAAEAFSAATNFKAIGEAIRNILGASLADTAIQDFKDLTRQIDREIGQVPGDNELAEIEKQLLEVNEKLDEAAELKKGHKDEIATFIALRDEITEQLRTLEGAKEIQARVDEKERDLEQVAADIKTAKQDLVRWVGQRAIQVVSRKLAKQTLDFVDEASLKGRIPSPYNEEFVRGLLQTETCICERDIKPGTSHWQAVANLLKNASNAEILGLVVRARGRINQLREEAAEAPKGLETAQARLARFIDTRGRLEQEVAELRQKIQSLPLAEIAERERKRKSLDGKIQDRNQKLGTIRAMVHELDVRKEQFERHVERIARTNTRAQKLLNKRHVLTRGSEFLKGFLGQYEREAREVIEQEVNTILDKVAHRDYRCRINPNFSIELTFSDGRPTPKSGGENQLLSLVFIASLVKFAASRINDESLILKPGTVAPLVLDAPFGQLDMSYQESTASYIPKLAQQVVLLVSSSQGNEQVLKALEPHVGAEYVLISENKEARGNKTETRLVAHGKEHVTSLFSQQRTMTRIERIM